MTDYLTLVNQRHPISPSFRDTIELVEVAGVDSVYRVEKKTAEAFFKLKSGLEKKGVIIGADSGYRSVRHQEKLMADFIAAYGEEYAMKTVAKPGTSEHHTGLAMDIIPMVDGAWVNENDDLLKQPEVFRIIHEALPDYGFILRYPKGKEAVTGYSYEPWHIRYIDDVSIAKEIFRLGITLEEYLERTQSD